MTANDLYPSKFLSKDDVPQPRIVTITKVSREELTGDGGKEWKAVIHFAEAKSMVLNRINGTVLFEELGKTTDDWINKQIEIFVDPSVMMGGKRVGGLRLRPVAKAAPAAPPQDQPNGYWSLDQAKQEAAKAGITEQEVRMALQQRGVSGWVPNRDTDMLRSLIEQKRASASEVPW